MFFSSYIDVQYIRWRLFSQRLIALRILTKYVFVTKRLQANGPISIIFGGVIRLYPVMVLIYFPCPYNKYRFLVISIFSL